MRPPAPTRSNSDRSVSGWPLSEVTSTLSSPRSVSLARSWLNPDAEAPTRHVEAEATGRRLRQRAQHLAREAHAAGQVGGLGGHAERREGRGGVQVDAVRVLGGRGDVRVEPDPEGGADVAGDVDLRQRLLDRVGDRGVRRPGAVGVAQQPGQVLLHQRPHVGQEEPDDLLDHRDGADAPDEVVVHVAQGDHRRGSHEVDVEEARVGGARLQGVVPVDRHRVGVDDEVTARRHADDPGVDVDRDVQVGQRDHRVHVVLVAVEVDVEVGDGGRGRGRGAGVQRAEDDLGDALVEEHGPGRRDGARVDGRQRLDHRSDLVEGPVVEPQAHGVGQHGAGRQHLGRVAVAVHDRAALAEQVALGVPRLDDDRGEHVLAVERDVGRPGLAVDGGGHPVHGQRGQAVAVPHLDGAGHRLRRRRGVHPSLVDGQPVARRDDGRHEHERAKAPQLALSHDPPFDTLPSTRLGPATHGDRDPSQRLCC